MTALADQSFSLPRRSCSTGRRAACPAAPAWFLLKARGATSAYFLLGGLDAWKSDVLFPSLAPDPTPDQQKENEAMKRIAAHFGGQAMTAGPAEGRDAGARRHGHGGDAAGHRASRPSGVGAPSGAPKKRKEGC